MPDDPLVHRMTEALVAAQRRHRKSQTGFGAYVTPAIPQQALDAFAAVMVPVIRQIVAEAVAQERARA